MRYNPVDENQIHREGKEEEESEEEYELGCGLQKHRTLGDYLFSNCDVWDRLAMMMMMMMITISLILLLLKRLPP